MFYGPIPPKMQIDHKDGWQMDNRIWNLRLVKKQFNDMNSCKKTSNSSGFTGVHFTEYQNLTYWVAGWQDFLTSTNTRKKFSIKKLGNDRAFESACKYRIHMMEEQNRLGAKYTERHGK
jgi:hypothetical protein